LRTPVFGLLDAEEAVRIVLDVFCIDIVEGDGIPIAKVDNSVGANLRCTRGNIIGTFNAGIIDVAANGKHVFTNREVEHDVVAAATGEDKGIATRATDQQVVPGTTVKDIVPGAAKQDVIAIATLENIVPRTAQQLIVACTAQHDVIAATADHKIIACATIKDIIVRTAKQGVVTGTT
jgi:hypothetical protein